ncbi:hypothetical protein F2P81_023780 [Scophthalmus maximus]|uniref:Uncharacterized protein n=1 Tax=Scophthalmus maximus TaxID=52904 RepID=A0A6A4RUV1_SCOMX|nr:hypothetical protein F2P81_023780 [Scophthalmus maximus]
MSHQCFWTYNFVAHPLLAQWLRRFRVPLWRFVSPMISLHSTEGHDAFCRRTTEKNDTTLSEPSCDSGNGARGGNVNMPSRYSCRKTNIAKYWTSSPT